MPKYRCPICGKILEQDEIVFGNKENNKWEYTHLKSQLNYSFICRKCHSNIFFNVKKYDRYVRCILILPLIVYSFVCLTWLISLFGEDTIIYDIFCFITSPITKLNTLYNIQYPIAWFCSNILFAVIFFESFMNYNKLLSKILPCAILTIFLFGIMQPVTFNMYLSLFRWFLPFLIIFLLGYYNRGECIHEIIDRYRSLGYSYSDMKPMVLEELKYYNSSCRDEDKDIHEYSSSSGQFEEQEKWGRQRNEEQEKSDQDQKRFRDIEENRKKDQERQRQVNEATYQRQREFKENQRQKNETIMVAYQSGSFVEVRNMNNQLMFRRSGNLSGYTSSTVTVYKDCASSKLYTVYNNKGAQIRQFSSN